MQKEVELVRQDITGNYVLPFLWMKGEPRERIRREIEKIRECGIRAFCVESRPHPDFLGPKWWEDLHFVVDTAKELGMKVWILDDSHFPTGYANGLITRKYPELRKKYLNYSTADVWSRQMEVTIPVKRMMKKLVSFLDLEKPRDEEEIKRNRLVAVIAVRIADRKTGDEEAILDLTDQVRDGMLTCTFPEGAYRVFVIFETRIGWGNPEYINMLDADSCRVQIEAIYEPHYEHLKEDFGDTILGFFSDEPGFGNNRGFDMDEVIGKPDMPLLWSRQEEELYAAGMGKEWKKSLPFLWMDSVQGSLPSMARYRYMDAASHLYQKNFSELLGCWCEEHGVSYIGHVIEDDNMHSKLGCGAGHYFRSMAGQHMAGVDIIGDQVAFGGAGLTRGGLYERDGEFNHYALCKLGSSAAAIDPKKRGRCMCEIFGAYGWRFGVRDMKWVLDHALVRGVNYIVPHAFSVADYPDEDCPPHFYAGGNNPQFEHFGDLMRYANRMCELFNGGKAVTPVGVLYQAEGEWAGKYMKMQKVARKLTCSQIEFVFLPIEAVLHPENHQGKFEDHSLYLNGTQIRCLVVPYAEKLPAEFLDFAGKQEMPVVFVEDLPSGTVYPAEKEKELLGKLAEVCRVVPLKNLPCCLEKYGCREIGLRKSFPDLSFRHYRRDGDYFMFFNESPDRTFAGNIRLPLSEGAAFFDVMNRKLYHIPVMKRGNAAWIYLELPPYASCVVLDAQIPGLPVYRSLSYLLSKCTMSEISGPWNYGKATAKQYPFFTDLGWMDVLVPYSRIEPDFSGYLYYEKEVDVDRACRSAYLEFEKAGELVDLWVNDEYVGMRLQPPYVFDIGGLLRKGKNRIRAEVTTTLDREQMRYPEPPACQDYQVMEATGLCGKVKLYLKK